MKILVTGGAGLIGRHVVDRLVRNGHTVVSIVRTPRETEGLLGPSVEVVGDISDVQLVRAQMADGIEAVVHLAAVASPTNRTAVELLQANVITTMTVLEAAGECGVKNVVAASSISVLGMAWAKEMMHPLSVPVDEDHPLRPTEGYALSKEADEASMRMAARRWGMTVIGLRFPFTTTQETILQRAALVREGGVPAERAAKELWAYLDVRDAATAVEQSLEAAATGAVSGATVLNVMADDVLTGQPLAELLREWHPGVPVSTTLGAGAYSTARAQDLIGFQPEHLLPRSTNVHE